MSKILRIAPDTSYGWSLDEMLDDFRRDICDTEDDQDLRVLLIVEENNGESRKLRWWRYRVDSYQHLALLDMAKHQALVTAMEGE